MTMTTKGKQQHSNTFKAILICCLLFFLLFLFIRTKLIISSSVDLNNTINGHETTTTTYYDLNKKGLAAACTKIPSSLSHALIKYVTSNIIPQQTTQEISLSLNVLSKKSPCNFLVFGLGHDSLMWASLNHGGRTVFLEEDKNWIVNVTKDNPSLESYHVHYRTNRTQAEQLHRIGMQQPACRVVTDPRLSECELVLKGLPSTTYDTEWDVIMVDAPKGYADSTPGRMSVIYTAGLMARNRQEGGETHIFVHDVHREVEDKFSNSFLCKENMVEQFGIMRHFIVPSYKSKSPPPPSGAPFCP